MQAIERGRDKGNWRKLERGVAKEDNGVNCKEKGENELP